jgi:hypothetical protein
MKKVKLLSNKMTNKKGKILMEIINFNNKHYNNWNIPLYITKRTNYDNYKVTFMLHSPAEDFPNLNLFLSRVKKGAQLVKSANKLNFSSSEALI